MEAGWWGPPAATCWLLRWPTHLEADEVHSQGLPWDIWRPADEDHRWPLAGRPDGPQHLEANDVHREEASQGPPWDIWRPVRSTGRRPARVSLGTSGGQLMRTTGRCGGSSGLNKKPSCLFSKIK